MTMTGVLAQADVGHHNGLGRGLLDGSHSTRDEVVVSVCSRAALILHVVTDDAKE